MLCAVVLSICTGGAGCEWPIYARMFRMLTPSFAFKNKAPISDLVALATTMRRGVDNVNNAPLCCCSPLFGFEIMNKCPSDLLCASGSFKPTYKCILRIMSLAAYRFLESEWVAH
jgi:hypothetical protein